MSELPPPVEPSPPPARGGAGWSVRQPARAPAPTNDWDTPTAPLPPPVAPVASTPPPFSYAVAPVSAPPRRSMARVWIAAGVAAALVFGGLFLVGHRSAAPVTDSAAVASPAASATPTPAPTAAPISAAAIAAGHEYLAVVAPLNAAETTFGLTLTAAMHRPCACPAGEFDASPAMKLIPGIDRDLEAFQVTLEKIKKEVPSLLNDIDPVESGNQLVLSDYARAYTGWQQNDPSATDRIADVATQETAARADITRLRADLGLPPPAGGSGPTSTLTRATVPA